MAAVHAGRPGWSPVWWAAPSAMRDLGARSVDAVVGPSVCACAYEVPGPMREDVARVAPVSATVSWTGTPAVDVAAGVVAQLADSRSPSGGWPAAPGSGRGLYSYRGEGTTGRFAGVVARSW